MSGTLSVVWLWGVLTLESAHQLRSAYWCSAVPNPKKDKQRVLVRALENISETNRVTLRPVPGRRQLSTIGILCTPTLSYRVLAAAACRGHL
jgi:hypothetical protein